MLQTPSIDENMNILIFGDPSLLDVQSLRSRFRTAEKIFVLDCQACLGPQPDFERTKQLILGVCPGACVELVGHNDNPNILYRSNREFVDFLIDQQSSFLENPILKRLHKIHEDPGLIRGITVWLVNRLRPIWYLRKYAEHLAGSSGKILVIMRGQSEFGMLESPAIELARTGLLTRLAMALKNRIRLIGHFLYFDTSAGQSHNER